MAEPNPLWGVHAAPGAITGALVQRTADGAFRVLETLIEEAPEDEDALLAATVRFLGRSEVAGRAAHVAVPDDDGAFLRVKLTPEEQFLDDHELVNELFERTRLEPNEGRLVFRRLEDGGGRDLLVAATSHRTLERQKSGLAPLDAAFHGVGLTGPAVLRGAQALGLTSARTLLVDVQAHQTVITAATDQEVRRYLLPAGRTAVGTDADTLMRDIVRIARYDVEQATGGLNSGDISDEDLPQVVFVGPGAAAAARLLHRLPPAMQRQRSSEPVVRAADGSPLPRDQAQSIAVAVGAALEALAPPAARLALRPPPADVPAYVPPRRPVSTAKWVAAAVVVALLAVVAWRVLPGEDESRDAETATGAHVSGGDAAGADRAALRAALDTAARRRAFAEAVGLACQIIETARVGPPSALLVLQKDGAPASETAFVVEIEWDATSISDDEQARALSALAALPGVRADSTEPDSFAAAGRVGVTRAGETVLEGPPAEPAPAAGATLAAVATRRRAERTSEGQRIELAPAEVASCVRDVLAAPTAPAYLGLTTTARDVVVATLHEGAGSSVTAGLPAGARAFLDEVEAAVAATSARLPASLVRSRTATPPAAAPTLVSASDGEVRLRLPAGSGSLVVERAAPGDPTFVVVLEAAAGREIVDHVPGRSGIYRWRVRAPGGEPGPDVEASIAIPVVVSLLTADLTTGTAHLRLARRWRDGTAVAELEVTAGSAVRTTATQDGQTIALETPFTVVGVEGTPEAVAVPVTVPLFAPDGRVLRDAAGQPRTASTTREGQILRPIVRAVDRAGSPMVWTAFEK